MKAISNRFMVDAYRLSNSTRNPQRAIKTMRRSMNSTIRLLKAIYVVDLLEKMTKRGLVLSSVMKMARGMCSGLKGDKAKLIADMIMQWKLQDANRVLKEKKRENTRIWREDRAILSELQVSQKYLEIWQNEKHARREELKRKKEKKILFLLEKTKKEKSERERREDVDYVRGINVCDQKLDEKYESRPRCYGGVQLSTEEKAILTLTPKYCIFDRPNLVECEIEIEKALTKLRWDRMGDRKMLENLDSDDEGNDQDDMNRSNTVTSVDMSGISRTSQSIAVNRRLNSNNNNSDKGDKNRTNSELSGQCNTSSMNNKNVSTSDSFILNSSTSDVGVVDWSFSSVTDSDLSRTNSSHGSIYSTSRADNGGANIDNMSREVPCFRPVPSLYFRPLTSSVQSDNESRPSTIDNVNENNSSVDIGSDTINSIVFVDETDTSSNKSAESSRCISRAERSTSHSGRAKICPPEDDRTWPYDPESKTLDLRYLRSTDLPFNSYVHMPPPLKEDEEIKFQNLKRDLIKTAGAYIKETDLKRGNKAYENLSEVESKGLASLMEREDIVIFQTDKSGRMAVDSKPNYIEATAPHIANDSIIDDETHARAQKQANAHSSMWVRFRNSGEETGTSASSGEKRIKSSMK